MTDDKRNHKEGPQRALVVLLLAAGFACIAIAGYIALSGNNEEPPPGEPKVAEETVSRDIVKTPEDSGQSQSPAEPENPAPAVDITPQPAPAKADVVTPAETTAPDSQDTPAPPTEPADSGTPLRISPIMTKGGPTFVVPVGMKYNVILNLCQVNDFLDVARAMEGGAGGPTALELLAIQFPSLPVALKAGDVAPEDVVELVLFVAGEDAPVSGGVAFTMELRHPERLVQFVRALYSGIAGGMADAKVEVTEPEPGHITVLVGGANANRLDFRTVPVDLSSLPAPSSDGTPSERRFRKATHVVFATMSEPDSEPRPLPPLASAAKAREVVQQVERISPDPRNRWVMAWGEPGEELEDGLRVDQFLALLNVPPRAAGDVAATLLGLESSGAVHLHLRLARTATEEDVSRWLARLSEEVGPMMQQLAPMALAMSGLPEDQMGTLVSGLGLLAEAALEHTIDDRWVKFSLSTRNVSGQELGEILKQVGDSPAALVPPSGAGTGTNEAKWLN